MLSPEPNVPTKVSTCPDFGAAVLYTASRVVISATEIVSPGALLVRDGIVVASGRLVDVAKVAPAGALRIDWLGTAIVPGLVNAHTHLQIPSLPSDSSDGAEADFVDWLLNILAWRKSAAPESFAENAMRAALEAASFGTTAVGEIGGPDPSGYGGVPLRGRLFAEGIGFTPEQEADGFAAVTTALSAFDRIAELSEGRLSTGVSPHTLYTVGDRLLRRMSALAADRRLPSVLHLAEHEAERAFLDDGTGLVATRLYKTIGRDVSFFHGLRGDLVGHLRETGLLGPSLSVVHAVHLSHDEIDTLHAAGVRFILCPRSNAGHGNGVPDVAHFVDKGIPFALGTDSLASVPDLDLFSEARAAAAVYDGELDGKSLGRVLLAAMTANGSAALSLPGGTLNVGEPADFVVIDDPGGADDAFAERMIERSTKNEVRRTVVAGRMVFEG